MSGPRKSICVDCVLFTLKDADVFENKYVSIFFIWLSVLCKTADLDEHDLLNIKVDARTEEYLSKDLVFTKLLESTKFQKQVTVFPPPLTLKEGTMMRYGYIEFKQDIYMYCDIDILVLKSLHIFSETMIPDSIYLHAEGLLTNSNYGADFTKEELSSFIQDSVGFSSGKFFIYGKDLYKEFTFLVENNCAKSSNKYYYTLDQPYFNKAVYMLNREKCNVNYDMFNPKTIPTHLEHYSYPTAFFIGGMGEPGDGSLHLQKLIRYYIMFQLGQL